MARAGGNSSPRSMTMAEHIREIQIRFFFVASVFIAGATLAYVFRDEVIYALLSPLGEQTLIYLNPAGGFSFILLVSLYCGLLVATPLFIHQLYSFIRPLLPTKVQDYSLRIFFISLVLLIAGAAFGYFMAVPGALNFLNTFAEEYIVASLTADSYLNFIVAYTIGLGLVFQLPLLLMLIHWIKPLTPGGLLRSERWIIVMAFLAAAIITPTPDPVNQAIVAAPIVVLYQLGVIAVLINIRKAKKETVDLTKNGLPALEVDVTSMSEAVESPKAERSETAGLSEPIIESSERSRPVRSVDGFRPATRPAASRLILPERQVYDRQRSSARPPAIDRRIVYIDDIRRVAPT